MLTREMSRTGIEVLRKDGKLLASLIDPAREAQAWAVQAGATSPKNAQKSGYEVRHEKGSAFIVGLGCGYHVKALKQMCPDLNTLILEPDREVADFALERNPEINPMDVIVESDWLRLTDHGAVVDLLGTSYRVLIHGATCLVNGDWGRNVRAFLLGRDKASFLVQLRARPELFSLLGPDKIEALGDEPISIKTLQKLFANQSAGSHERRLWRVLEELVL